MLGLPLNILLHSRLAETLAFNSAAQAFEQLDFAFKSELMAFSRCTVATAVVSYREEWSNASIHKGIRYIRVVQYELDTGPVSPDPAAC